MTSKIKINEREIGANIEITLPNGNLYRITFNDKENLIRVTTVDGGLLIRPSVSNEIRISTDEH